MDFSQNLWSFDRRKCFKASQGLCVIAKYPVRAIEVGALHYFQVVESGERGIGGDLVKFLQDLHKGHHVQAPATRTFCLSVPTQCTELNYMPYQLSLPVCLEVPQALVQLNQGTSDHLLCLVHLLLVDA